MPISVDNFGDSVSRWSLTNSCGASVQIIDYGATITSFCVPARDGEIVDIILGYDDIESYKSSPFYLGCTIGRCTNRIAGAAFELDGRKFQLNANNGVNHLHGGVEGFDKKQWQFHDSKDDDSATFLSLRLLSSDGDECYPGNVCVIVKFSLALDSNVLTVEYLATTDAPTVVNLTNHSYFNLSGDQNGTIYDQNLQVFASKYLQTDSSGLSVGNPVDVDGTVFDYRDPVMIGYRLEHMVTAKNTYGGIDNSYVGFSEDDSGRGDCLKTVAVLTSDVKKIRLKVSTTKPALHVYTGNYLDDSIVGKGGARYKRHSGICFETQIQPDAINRPEFPSPVLRPGQEYRHVTVFDVAERPSLQWC